MSKSAIIALVTVLAATPATGTADQGSRKIKGASSKPTGTQTVGRIAA